MDNAASGDGAAAPEVPQEAPKAAQSTPRPAASTPPPEPAQGTVASAAEVATDNTIDAIRKEGLTGRQLRMARRVAQKNGLAVTSDFDAVKQLRDRGVDPFQRANILELVVPEDTASAVSAGPGMDAAPAAGAGVPANPKIQLPQTVPAPGQNLLSTEVNPAERRASEIHKIQRDIAKRRRLRVMMLFSRLAFFVFLPTIVAGWYFYVIATPMYATYSEFVIQKAESGTGPPGLGGLFQGTGLATQQDSVGVQSYLQSRDALNRLDQDLGFKAHFSDPDIDVIQRLPEGASTEDAFDLYKNHVQIGYDPTEGLLKMEVIAADPQVSMNFSEALLGYAEEEVDGLTERVREDQMAGARDSYEEAEVRREESLKEWIAIQSEVGVIDAAGETGALVQQIAQLESQLIDKELELISLNAARRPNQARVNGVESEISGLRSIISRLKSEATDAGSASGSNIDSNTRLRVAEENYNFQTVMVQQALQQMETARIEANRQVSYISRNVEPIAPDAAAYPKAFENTILAFLIFAGVYLMFSLTSSILREQVSS